MHLNYELVHVNEKLWCISVTSVKSLESCSVAARSALFHIAPVNKYFHQTSKVKQKKVCYRNTPHCAVVLCQHRYEFTQTIDFGLL